MVQATALGLVGHQMAGFDAKKAREVFNVPTNYEPAAGFTLYSPTGLAFTAAAVGAAYLIFKK